MVYIKISELKKLPHIAGIPANNQTFNCCSYFDEDRKQYFIPYFKENEEMILLYAEPVEGLYYSKSKVDNEKDLFIDFFNVLICDYSYTFGYTFIDGIVDDISNLSAVFEKYFIFLNYMSANPEKYKMVLIQTEIEYFFGVVRSLYDLLQKLIKQFVIANMKQELTDSFARMFDDKTHELKSKYIYLPPQLINYYSSSAEFFFKCRDIRNKMHHTGSTYQLIYHFEEGFGINQDLFSFSKDDIWPQDKIKENGIVSLLALFAYVTKAVIQNINKLASVLLKEFKPQNRFISNDYRIFFRGACTEHLNKLDKYLDEQWF